MRIRIAAGLVALLASAGASAQPVPAGHQQHQAAAKHEHAKSGCCCDKHMREMMSMMHEMMKMHPGMDMHQDMKAPTPEKASPPSDTHSH